MFAYASALNGLQEVNALFTHPTWATMDEMWQLYRLMVFNVLIGNRDDHAKNFSFLYDEGWHLAPAYDLLPCGIKGDYHTTSVNDNPDPKKEDIFALAQRVSLPEKEAEKIYAEIEGLITYRR